MKLSLGGQIPGDTSIAHEVLALSLNPAFQAQVMMALGAHIAVLKEQAGQVQGGPNTQRCWVKEYNTAAFIFDFVLAG